MNFSITLTGKKGGRGKYGEDEAILFDCLSAGEKQCRFVKDTSRFSSFFVRGRGEKGREGRGGNKTKGEEIEQTHVETCVYRDNSKRETNYFESYFVVLDGETREKSKSLFLSSLGNFARPYETVFWFCLLLESR